MAFTDECDANVEWDVEADDVSVAAAGNKNDYMRPWGSSRR